MNIEKSEVEKVKNKNIFLYLLLFYFAITPLLVNLWGSEIFVWFQTIVFVIAVAYTYISTGKANNKKVVSYLVILMILSTVVSKY